MRRRKIFAETVARDVVFCFDVARMLFGVARMLHLASVVRGCIVRMLIGRVVIVVVRVLFSVSIVS